MAKRFGVKLDGVTLEELGLFLREGHQHPLLPSTNDRTVTVPDRPGAYDFGATMGVREFVLPMGVYPAASRSEMQQNARRIISHLIDGKGRPKTVQVVFDYWQDVFYKVRYSGSLPLARLMEYGEFDLPLIAYDPHSYSRATQGEVTWGSTSVTYSNMQYKMGRIGVGSLSIKELSTIIYPLSGVDVRPIFRIVGNGRNVTFQVKSRRLTIENLGNVLWVIDGETYKVTRKGSNALSEIDGDFLTFSDGDNALFITGNDLDFTLQVDYRNKEI